MTDYKPDSFKYCLFNPLGKDLLSNPSVSSLKPKGDNGDKLLRYILMLYDPKSPLVKDVRNIKTRKQEAARIAGFDLVKDTDFLDEVFSFKHKEVLEKSVLFLKEFIHTRTWSMIVSLEQTFYEYNERLMKPVADGEKEKDVMATIVLKSKLFQDLKEIHTLLKEYYEEMFPDAEMRDKIINSRVTPETMARV